jgi:hypothetical protein
MTTSMNLTWKFTACAVVLGCAMVLPGAAYARGGGGGGFHGGGGFYGGGGGFYGGRGGFYGGRGGFYSGRGGFYSGRGSLHGGHGGFQGGRGGFHNGVPIGGQGSGGFHNGVPIGGEHIGEGRHRGRHPSRRHHQHWRINPMASAAHLAANDDLSAGCSDLSFGAPHSAGAAQLGDAQKATIPKRVVIIDL